ncbi:MAG TPA: phenylalanine--tRNA ligase subunit beta, partial [Candidatus Saccharimonadales bacterium]|nr:phenylalanine--tRNA ligase subunit beta [Candidatus Saccharimonadales bacterium]
ILEIREEEVDKTLMLPGTPFVQLYGLDDYLLEIENKMFTHRPDLFGLLGVSREIAGIQNKQFHSPSWYTNPHLDEGSALKLEVRNELSETVPRFMAVTIADVSVKSSPIWLQSWLTKLGIRPINNIVDLTNYYMLLTGQPLHAYDYDKMKNLCTSETPTLIVRNPHSDETLTLLNNKTITPRSDAILIATDRQAIGLGGVMGGANTEVDYETKNIILECATFDMYSIRRTAMEHGIFTDAVTRFTKGQSPLQNPSILARAVSDLSDQTGGHVASTIVDVCTIPDDVIARGNIHPEITVSATFINDRLGLKLDISDMQQLLENVEFAVTVNDNELTVSAPFWRTDIELREDIVEEIGRLYGFDLLPKALPHRDVTPANLDPILELNSQLRSLLSAAGANEMLSYSFVHGDLMAKSGQDKASAFQLGNALSPDLQYYRLSLIPSVLSSVHPNIKQGFNQFVLFEIGKTHSKDLVGNDGLPTEERRLALVCAVNEKTERAEYGGASYFMARAYLTRLLDELGIVATFEPADTYDPTMPVSKAVIAPFNKKRTALIKSPNGQFIGVIGEFSPAVRHNFKLPNFCAGFELDIAQLQALLHPSSAYKAIPRFPKISQDVTFKLPANVDYQTLYGCVSNALVDAQSERVISSLEPIDIYQAQDSSFKHITFRYTIANYDRTLNDKEVSALLEKAAAVAHDTLGTDIL